MDKTQLGTSFVHDFYFKLLPSPDCLKVIHSEVQNVGDHLKAASDFQTPSYLFFLKLFSIYIHKSFLLTFFLVFLTTEML